MISSSQKEANLENMRAAFKAASPWDALKVEVKKLVADGLEQHIILRLLECVRKEAASDEEIDVIDDVVDLACGNSRNQKKLFQDLNCTKIINSKIGSHDQEPFRIYIERLNKMVKSVLHSENPINKIVQEIKVLKADGMNQSTALWTLDFMETRANFEDAQIIWEVMKIVANLSEPKNQIFIE